MAPARGAGSTPISVELTVRSTAPEAEIEALIAEVERVAEIPMAISESPGITIGTTIESSTA